MSDNIRNLFIFGGPSGSGKTYVANMLTKAFPTKFQKLEQCTTRKMREGEKPGDPYQFIEEKDWSSFYPNLIFTSIKPHAKYGTFTNNIDLEKHQIVIADIDALKLLSEDSYTFRKCYELFNSIYIIGFVYDPDKENNRIRMKGRENRDNSIYFKFNEYADFIFENDSDNYLTVDDTYSQLMNLYHHTDKNDYSPKSVQENLKKQFGL